MKKNNKILIGLTVLLALMLVFGLTACKKDQPEAEETTAGTTSVTTTGSSTPEKPIVPLKLIDNGSVKVSIVYPSDATPEILNSLALLSDTFAEKYNVEITASSDAELTVDDSKIEILLGKTKYEVSGSAQSELDDYSYSVSVRQNKIVISANHDYLFTLAVEHFLESLYEENGTVSIAKDYSHESDAFYSAFLLDADGMSDYTVIYEANSASALAAAQKLQEAFDELQVAVNIKPDSESENGKEILLGNTNRELSFDSEAYYMNSYLELDNDGNLAITGNVGHGADVLIEYMKTLGASGGDVILVEPMLGLFKPSGIGQAPLYEFGGEAQLIEGFGPSKSYYLTIHGASRGDFQDYTDVLAGEGFSRYRSSNVNGNLFETWTDGYSILTMAHISYMDPATTDSVTASQSLGRVNYISIAVDCIENSALPTLEEEIADITTEQMTSIGTSYGYVLRLSDGRFIVFDGGVAKYASTIYETVVAQNVLEGKPVIAAWYISHFHSDHIDSANEFMKNYYNDVEIQSFIYNLPGDYVYIDKNTAEGSNNVEDTNMRDRGFTMYERLAEFYPDTQIFVAHAGQQFRYGNIYIDILWTSENLYGKQMYDTNMSSVLISVTGKTGRMIMLGDQQEYGCAMMNAIYGSTLECDLVHVAHHGYNGGDEDMYANMAAKYAIWSSSVEAIYDKKLHYNPSYGRNKFDYTTVDANIAPRDNGGAIILHEGMTREDMLALDVKLTH